MATCTRKSLDLEGYAAGTPAFFKVVASNGTGEALPSAMASVYAPAMAAPVQLRVA